MSKKDWDIHFLELCRKVSEQSIDPSTKHGCVLVKNKKIVATGYNGPLSEIDDTQVPLTRPDKYDWMIHSEINALLFCKDDLHGATAYITGHPCAKCFVALAQAGVKKIVHGELMAKCISDREMENIRKMATLKGVELVVITNERFYETPTSCRSDTKFDELALKEGCRV